MRALWHIAALAGLIPLAALATIVAAAPPEAPQEAQNGLALTYIGNEAMALSDGQVTLVSDFPYRSGYSVYMRYDPAWLDLKGNVVALITHRHLDHFDPALFAGLDWKLIGPKEVSGAYSDGRVLPLAPRMAYADIAITALSTRHSTTEHYSYLVEWKGLAFFYAGDIETLEALAGLAETLGRPVDIAFLSPWAVATALKRGEPIAARRVIFYHQMVGEPLPHCPAPLDCGALDQGETLELRTE